MMRKSQHTALQRRAFSLLEVLLAIALTAGVLAAAFSIGLGVHRARDRAATFTQKSAEAQAIVQAVEDALLSIAPSDSRSEPSLRGDASSLTIVFDAVPVRDLRGSRAASLHAPAVRRVIQFDRAASMATLEDRSLTGGGASTSATTGEDVGEDEGSAEDVPSFSEDADASSSSAPARTTGRYIIGEVQFRYHDGNGWRTSFDSSAARKLPVAIEVSIWFEASDDSDHVFSDPDERVSAVPPDEASRRAGGFDEDAAADRTERMIEIAPLPDRLRIISLRQSAQASSLAGELSANATPSADDADIAPDDERDHAAVENADA